MTAPPSPACGRSRVARGPGHERAAWGPAGGAAWARPAPPGTWAGLAFISGCGRSSEHKGTSWGTFPALPPRTPPPWGTWSAGAVWGVRTGAPRGPAGPTRGAAPLPARVRFGACVSRGSPGHSRRHSWAASAVPRAHGRSWKAGRQRSQSTPVVLCWQWQTSRPAASGPHALACPLHLHLGKERGGRGAGNRGGYRRRGRSPGGPCVPRTPVLWLSFGILVNAYEPRATENQPPLGSSGLNPHATDGGAGGQGGCPRPRVSDDRVHEPATAGSCLRGAPRA